MEKIIIGSDHAGFKLKKSLIQSLRELNYEPIDIGTSSEESCDYPDFAHKVASEVAKSKGRGIVICGTGIGSCIVANKVRGIRAALVFDEYTAKVSREHNNSNILCLGERTTSEELAKKITKIWLETPFSTEERHKRRVSKIEKIDEETCK